MNRSPAPPPIPSSQAGLYLHIPFCSTRCPYCDFATRVDQEELRDRYVDAVIAEMALLEGESWLFDTVYFGGGTPSLLNGGQLDRLLTSIAAHFSLAPETWIFLEANPEHATRANLAMWRRVGIRTLSLGIQSFDDAELHALGRAHTAEQARRTVQRALAAGFHTLSIDLIYGLPEQGAGDWERTLETACTLAPDHLSCYQLTVHERTAFGRRRARGELHEQPEEQQADLFFATHQLLAAAGRPAYEISSFARSAEHQSRHNWKYWTHVPYLGLGSAAHSYRDRRRWWNESSALDYVKQIEDGRRPTAGSETLSDQELAREAIMLELRTTRGIDLSALEQRTAINLEEKNARRLALWEREGLLVRRGARLVPTQRGLALADRLAAEVDL